MKLKDALVGFLFWIGILAFGLFLISADSLPMWVLFTLAAIAWAAYILVIMRDKAREKRRNQPQFYVKTPSGNVVPLDRIPQPQFYDQEEEKKE